MKQEQIKKTILSTTEALEFARGSINKGKIKDKIIAQPILNSSYNTRISFAPKGDKRLTINIKQELHKKLKIAAIEGGITVGEIVEQLVEDNL